MKIIPVIMVTVALTACGIQTSTTEQNLCTAEDQQNGTCPETAWLVDLAVNQAEAQYGPSENHWAQCERATSGWSCTTRIDFPWGWVLTTCRASGVCTQVTHQNAIGAISPDNDLCPVDDELCLQEMQQRLDQEAADQISDQAPVQPVGQVPGGCNATRCRVDIVFPSFRIEVRCHRHTDGVIYCSSTIQNGFVSDREAGFCTEGDPNCGDPGGGGGPSGSDVVAATEGHADSVILQYQQSGYTLTGRSTAVCQSGERSCLVDLDFGNFTIHVTCYDYGSPRGVECWSHVAG